jgi:hypothetical protein
MKRSPIKSRSLKSRSVALAQAQAAFNAFIRARDCGLPCISCGEFKELQAGHYRSTAAAPEIRFSEENVNGQCERCNTTLAGNKPGYRRGIIDRYGPASLIMLDSLHMPSHFSASDLREISAKYSARAAELIADMAA